MAQPRILTFNFHEPYLCLLAKTGLSMDVGLYESGPMARPWHSFYRALPANLTLVPEKDWRRGLGAAAYDVLIAHNEMNALDVFRAPCAKLLVCHNRRTFLSTSVTIDVGDPVQKFDDLLEKLQNFYEFVFISPSKQQDYDIPGRVILPGIDVEEYGGYTGEERCVLRVGNMMRERNLMFDVDFQAEVLAGLPQRLVGLNPAITGSTPAGSFEDLCGQYRRNRCLLHVTRESYEDGYNLSMLEAMACGMPVVSLANITSPLTDGMDGFVSYEPEVLRERLQTLLDNSDLAREVGARSRETVAERFPVERFSESWREAIFEAAERRNAPASPSRSSQGMTPKHSSEEQRRKILLEYVSSPFTTARYFERAARENHAVVTAGFRTPEGVLRMWGFENPPAYPKQQINLPYTTTYETMLAQLPPGFSPDFLFWIDSGHDEIGADIASLPFPKLAYLIDTHIATELRVDMARKFDVVFVAQKGQIEHFRQAGIKSIYWLPLACDPELHAVGEQGGPRSKRIYDVAYVGSLSTTEGERRPKLLAAVAERFPNHRIGKFWPEEMARIYARSKIVVNACHNRDVNMRVFEGMASGALLITDEADGLEDLFEEGKHFVVYHRDDDLLDLIAYYLEHEEEREQIAGAGQKLVLRNHTYRRRFDLMLSVIEPRLGAARPASGVPSPPPSAAPKSTGYYRNVRREVMERVPRLARRILDVGCGAGALGHTLKTERGVDEVVGIEVIEEAYRAACEVLDKVLFGSIEELELPFPDDYFDCIICADVLEHLEEPAAALRKLSRVLAPDGTIVISIPNIRFHDVIRMLSLGGWSYMEAGIMDSTHLRFFTRESLGTFIASAGLEVLLLERLNGLAPYQAPREPDGSMLMEKVRLRDVGDDEHLDLLTIQYAVLAGKPGVDRLKRARLALEQGDAALAVSYAVDAVGVDEAERLRLLGKAFSRLGTLDKAEYFYRESLERRYEPNVLGELGMLLLGMNRAHEALPLLEQAHAEAPENDRVAGALGLALSVAGRLEEAYTHLLTALQASYETPTLLKHLQAVAVPLGRLAGVEPVFKSFAEFYAGDLDVACDYAELLVTLGRTREARERLEQVVLFAPEHERALALLQGMGPP